MVKESLILVHPNMLDNSKMTSIMVKEDIVMMIPYMKMANILKGSE